VLEVLANFDRRGFKSFSTGLDSIMSNPVLLYAGIVWDKEGSLYIGDTEIYPVLSKYLDKRITLSLHHWPDGSGAFCFYGSYCSQHSTNPEFLLNWKETGLLKDLESLNGRPIPYKKLGGHHCRMVLFWEDFKVSEKSPDLESVQRGSQDLSKLLENLQKTLKELK